MSKFNLVSEYSNVGSGQPIRFYYGFENVDNLNGWKLTQRDNGIAFVVFNSQETGTVKLFRHKSQSAPDKYYLSKSDLPPGPSWFSETSLGYVYPTASDNAVPVYQYRSNDGTYRYMYDTTPPDLIKGIRGDGWISEGVAFYGVVTDLPS